MKKYNSGSITILVLMMAVVFSIMLGGLILFVTTQYNFTNRGSARREALMLAEAGVEYYKWHLAHDPDDFQDGTGLPGPYNHEYSDPQGGVHGTFSLEIIPPEEGSTITIITSTGEEASGVKRTVQALFGRPSYAQFSFLNNASSWFGTGLTVYGRVMSNGGIRQDGVNTSIIQSSKETYTCGSETGCSPSEEKPGVWGSGGPSELWDFPVTAIDFDAVAVDLNQMRIAAINSNTHFGPSGNQGYHFVFNDIGSVDVYRVNNTGWRRGYSSDLGCRRLYQRISNESYLATYQLSEKKIFFAEDTVWVEGVVEGEATVVAARFPLDTNDTDIWIRDNIVYNQKDGSDSLGLIAENDINFVLDLPQIFEIDGALLAQDGRVYRHYYGPGCGNYGSAVRDQLYIFGSIMSNEKSAWNWGSGPSSGFITRDVTYDNFLYLSPPPYFPTESEYEFLSWQEVDNP